VTAIFLYLLFSRLLISISKGPLKKEALRLIKPQRPGSI